MTENDKAFFAITLIQCGCLVVPMFLTHFFGGWGALSILGLFLIPWDLLFNWYYDSIELEI